MGDAEFQRRCLGRMEEFGEHGADGDLRLAQHAGRRAALRSRDPDRRRPPGARRPGEPKSIANYLHRRIGGRRLDAHVASGRRRQGNDLVRLRVRAHRRTRTAPGDYVDVRRPVGDRDRFRRAARQAASRLPEDQGARPRRRDRVQRNGHRPSVARIPRRRATTWRQPGSRGTSERGLGERGGGRLLASTSRSSTHHVAVYEAVSFEVPDPVEGDSARGTVQRPVARRRPAAARLDGQVRAKRDGSSSASTAPVYV